MRKTVLIVGVILITALAIGWFAMSVTTKNDEVRLRNQIEAKISDSESHYTKMWEILTQQAGVTSEYKKAFQEIYPELIAGRYNNGGGQMMQWIQEHNPEFDSTMYKELMISIEGQRESFHTNQRQLIDLSRQHNNMLTTWPSSMFLSGIEPIEIPVIVNDATTKAFESGKETPMNLFGNSEEKE